MPTFGVRMMRVLCPLAALAAVAMVVWCVETDRWFQAAINGGLFTINFYLTLVQWTVFTPERRD